MKTVPLFLAVVLTALIEVVAASGAAAADLVSGIDRTGMNETIRAQDDFNLHVNGGWIERTPIPADKARWGSFDILREASDRDQRAIIEALAARNDHPIGSDERKVGDLFTSLMDEARANELGAQPVAEQLAQIDTISTVEELVRRFAEFHRIGINVPALVYVAADSHDASQYAVFLTQAGLGLPNRNYYLDQSPKLAEIRAQYPGYIAKLFALAGRSDGEAVAAKIFALETAIATAHWSPEDNRDATKTDNRFATAELATVSSRVAWPVFFAGAGLPELSALYVRQPSYVEKLGELLADTELDVWKSYLRFHVLNDAAPWLSSAFFDAHFDLFGRGIGGLEQPEPRWQRAVGAVNDAMGEAVGRAYVAKHFPPEAKRRMEALVHNLLGAFAESIDQLAWMSPETKIRAQEKRMKLGLKIGYPDKWKDYTTLVIQRDDAAGNLTRATAWENQRWLDRLGAPVDRSEWGMTPQTVNAYFNSRLNEIVFPAAILQPPFFNLGADDAVNYGGIGVVIGHEIGHAFDDQGRKSDANGNLHDWWTAADAAAFTARAQLLVEQFNGFQALDDLRVNGRLTLGENIGDLTGVVISYLAYQKSLAGRAAPVIDGLTGAQRFFFGYAQIWRNKMRSQAMRQQVLTNPHAPAQFRAIGPLRNFAPFYEAFGVQEGDGMFLPLEQRVKIW